MTKATGEEMQAAAQRSSMRSLATFTARQVCHGAAAQARLGASQTHKCTTIKPACLSTMSMHGTMVYPATLTSLLLIISVHHLLLGTPMDSAWYTRHLAYPLDSIQHVCSVHSKQGSCTLASCTPNQRQLCLRAPTELLFRLKMVSMQQ
jgi:hypothetical protein